jgi:N-acyl-D-aspartate/D-glutamate deacylase
MPGDIAGLDELIRAAEQSGAPLHICHLNASAMGAVSAFLGRIAQARGRGVDVTAEAYPYNAGSTTIGAAVFGRDWRRIFAIDYGDVEWAATGERLTPESFAEKRENEPEGLVIHHYGRESWTREALLGSGVMVASDAMPIDDETVGVHPRGIGTFSRFLGRYTRAGDAEGVLSLSEAIAKVSSQPARRLSAIAPVFRNKGHLGVGADADITVFDPLRIQDLATYQRPLEASVGIRLVLVGGVVVLEDGELKTAAKSGAFLRSRTNGSEVR